MSVLQDAAHARHLESLSRQQRLPWGPAASTVPHLPVPRVLPVTRSAPGERHGR